MKYYVNSDPDVLWDESFKENSNTIIYSYTTVDAYVNQTTGGMIGIIYTEEPYFTYVKRKLIQYLENDCQQNNSDEQSISQCKQSLKGVKFYKNNDFTETGYTKYMTVYVNSDPSIEWYNSFKETPIASQSNNLLNSYELKQLNVSKNSKNNVVRLNSTTSAKLTSLDLSNAANLKTIGDNSFSNSGINSINFGDSSKVSEIGIDAFSGNKITTLVLPISVNKLGNSAFANNPLKTLTIEKCSKEVCKIGVFGNNITDVTINSGEISDYAFSASSAEKVNIGSEVSKIGAYSFAKVNVMIEENFNFIVILDEDNFEKIKEFLISAEVNIPLKKASEFNPTEYSGNSMGYYIDLLTNELKLPFGTVKELKLSETTKLKEISKSSFEGSQISGELIIPSSVTTIGNNAFQNNLISKLYFPKTVTTLGNYAFSGNPFESLTIEECNLTICKGISNVVEKGNPFFGTQIKTLTIESGEIGDYAFISKSDSTTKISKLFLREGVTSIGYDAFQNNQIVGTIVIPSSVTTIKNGAFKNNQIGGALVIPNNVTTIGYGAFQNNQITSLILGGDLSSIGNCAFMNNQISEELIISDKVTTIGDESFSGNNISSITIPSSVTSIGKYAFYGNSMILNILIKRTEEDFLKNVKTGSFWCDKYTTKTFDPS